MAKIESGASADQLTVDPTSKGARVTAYDSAGNELNPNPIAIFSAPIEIQHTAAEPADTPIWAIAVAASGAKMYLRRIVLRTGFAGTATATRGGWSINRMSGGTLSGGTAIPIFAYDKSLPVTNTGFNGFLDTGLTPAASPVYESLGVFYQMTQLNAPGTLELNFTNPFNHRGRIRISNSEYLTINTAIVEVIGHHISGFIEWEER